MAGSSTAVDLRLMRAAALLDTDPAAAAREAAAILQEHPGHLQTLLLLGTAYQNSGDTRAVEIFTQLTELQPRSPLAHFERGRALARHGEQERALTALTRALELEPHLAEAWRELANVHAGLGDETECDKAYANFVRLAPPDQHLSEEINVGALRLLAAAVAEREDYVEAEGLLGECLTLAPGYSQARFELVGVLLRQQKAHPMLPLLERLLRAEPENVRYLSLQASAYGLLGHNERAI